LACWLGRWWAHVGLGDIVHPFSPRSRRRLLHHRKHRLAIAASI
jgi:hypothetical protein